MDKVVFKTEIGEQQEFDCEWNDDFTPIDKVMEWLVESKNGGATHIKFGGWASGDSTYMVVGQAVSLREESDEEFRKRELETIKRRIELDKKRQEEERAQYERLKAKFENK